MLNKKLTASYIKDVMRFMGMYHIQQVAIGLINDNNYLIIRRVFNNNYEYYSLYDKCDEVVISSREKSEFMTEFKDCKYYMVDVEVDG